MIRLVSISMLFLFLVPAQFVKADTPANVTSLKRLFTTPFERAQLDAMRRRNSFTQQGQQPDSNKPVLPPLTVEVKGVMLRKDGPNVIWVNDKNSMQGNKLGQDIKVSPRRISTKTLKVPVSARGDHIKLKPGQVWNQENRSIKDIYQTKKDKPQTSGVQNGANTDNTLDNATMDTESQDH